MAKQDINYGTTAGDGTGESLFSAFKKAKENFDELYGAKTEFVANAAALPATGETGKIYIAIDTGAIYRWTGSAYVALTFGIYTFTSGGVAIIHPLTGELIGAAMRTSPLKIATFGDSTANVGAINSAGGPDMTAVVAANWATGTTDLNIAGDKWKTPSFYPMAFLVANGGVSGQTTAQMLSRSITGDAQAAFSAEAIINLNPDVVILRGGSINDYAGGAPITLATGLAQHQQIINKFLAAGIKVVDVGMYGYSGTPGSLTLAQVQAIIVQFNAASKDYAKQFPGKVAFSDCASVVSDSTGAYLPYMSADGTHLSWYGQHKAAEVEAAALERLFGKSADHRYQTPNILTNPLFANPATLINTPTGFSAGVLNGTRQNYKREVINGKLFWTYEVVITGAGCYADLYLPYDPTAMGIVSGDKWGFECDYYIGGVGGLIPTITPAFSVETKHVSGGLVRHSVLNAGAAFQLPEPVIGRAVHAPIQYGDASANFTSANSIWHMKVPVAETSGTFKVGIASPRAVKLGVAQTTY